MLDLLNHLSNKLLDPSKAQNLNFDFPAGTKVTFVKRFQPISTTILNDTKSSYNQTIDKHRKLINGTWYHIELANTYEDLPDVALTPEEQTIVTNEKEKIEQNPKLYDGDNIFITGLNYDPKNNHIYVEAKKGQYSLLSSLKSGKFPEGSPVYQQKLHNSGTAAPFITNDGHTALLERKDGRYYSSAGYLEPKTTPDHSKKYLNFPGGSSLIEFTATSEAIEEALGDRSATKSRVPLSFPSIASLHYRYNGKKDKGHMGGMEWIAPIHLDINKNQLSYILETNRAPDAYEHTQNFEIVGLNPVSIQQFKARNLKGDDIYSPVLRTASRIHGLMPERSTALSSSKEMMLWSDKIKQEANQHPPTKTTLPSPSDNHTHRYHANALLAPSQSFVARISSSTITAPAIQK